MDFVHISRGIKRREEDLCTIHYGNYEISDEKYHFYYNKCDLEKQEISFKTVLRMQVHKFIANLKSEIDMYEADKLTNHVSCHITGRDSSMIYILSRVGKKIEKS